MMGVLLCSRLVASSTWLSRWSLEQVSWDAALDADNTLIFDSSNCWLYKINNSNELVYYVIMTNIWNCYMNL